MFKLDLEKEQEAEIKLSTSTGSSKKQESSRKTPTSALSTTPIVNTPIFDCVDHNKLENSSRDGNTRSPNLPPEKYICSSRTNRTGQQQTGSNLGKEYVKAVYSHPAYLTDMQSTS